jgi:hypothetical protein
MRQTAPLSHQSVHFVMIEIDWLAAVQRGLAAAKNTEDVEIGGSRGSRGSEIWSLNKINDLQDIGSGTPHEKVGVPAYEADNTPIEQLLSTSETPGTRGTPDFNKAGGILGASAPERELEDRKAMAMAAESVPERYLDAWATFQLQCPGGVTEQAWRQAIDDAGRFLNQWGKLADSFGWLPGDLIRCAARRRHGPCLVAHGQSCAGVGQPGRVTRREWINPYARPVRPVSLAPILERQ